ncbi:MAG TPA: FHA domain-containing protein [Phycisphaerae bacterium]|nr:FHA domain-containing protein [Phycisphaerae bacterium]
MSVVICCPCGTPIDAEHLDVVISLNCPQCKRELALEFELPLGGEGSSIGSPRRRAVLTVVDGPQWIGERFLVPVDVDLQIGHDLSNWLSLDDKDVSPVHCRLKLQSNGSLILEDKASTGGTWVGQQRIGKVRLGAKQSFRVGPYRLQLEHDTISGSAGIPSQESDEELSGLLPTMQRVGGKKTLFSRFVTRRYQIARGLMAVTAVLVGASNMLGLHGRTTDPWRWPPALALGICMCVALVFVSRRVTLADRRLRYLSVGLLIVLMLFDAFSGLPFAAASQGAMAVTLALLVIHSNPPMGLAVSGGLVGAVACGLLLTATILSLIS